MNNGIVPQYYVEDDHEAIISKELFYQVQEEIARRASMWKPAVSRKKNQQSKYSSMYALTGIVICGECDRDYRRVTWSRNEKKKIVWRCTNRLENGTKKCKDFPTLEEEALHNAIMEAMQKITGDNGDFVDAFRQNVIRVIGSYKKGPDEYDEKIKKKQDEMVALVMENAKQGAYTDEFDERYRKISDEINELKEAQKKENVSRRLAENYEQRVNEMDRFLNHTSWQLVEYDDGLVRMLISQIKVISKERLMIQFKSGIVMEQEIREM